MKVAYSVSKEYFWKDDSRSQFYADDANDPISWSIIYSKYSFLKWHIYIFGQEFQALALYSHHIKVIQSLPTISNPMAFQYLRCPRSGQDLIKVSTISKLKKKNGL